MSQHWCGERLEELKRLTLAGVQDSEIGKIFGIAESSVGGVRRKHGLYKNHPDRWFWTDEKKEALRFLYANFFSCDEIARITKRSRISIKRVVVMFRLKRGDPKDVDVSRFNTEHERWVRVKLDYAVSNLGRVISLKKQYFGKILPTWVDHHGYHHVTLATVKNRCKRHAVHNLVCTAFHGDRPGPEYLVAHGDGSRDNNNEKNLRWATPQENMDDRKRHGTNRVKRLPMRAPDEISSVF